MDPRALRDRVRKSINKKHLSYKKKLGQGRFMRGGGKGGQLMVHISRTWGVTPPTHQGLIYKSCRGGGGGGSFSPDTVYSSARFKSTLSAKQLVFRTKTTDAKYTRMHLFNPCLSSIAGVRKRYCRSGGNGEKPVDYGYNVRLSCAMAWIKKWHFLFTWMSTNCSTAFCNFLNKMPSFFN